VDSSSAAEQPTRPALGRDNGRAVQHRLEAGARLQLGPEGERRYSVACSCGWQSEVCGTAVLAEADGEQHLTLVQARRVTRRSGGV
jgi:hypothetical protein